VWHFIGSFRFALVLIASTAFFVIAGTWIEGCTGSHWCAAYYTYSSPFFALLLWGYFVNILVSALRRWPYRKAHIPFLLTHLGLLMLIGGVLTKIYFGTQGALALTEGKGNDEIFINPSEALYIETVNSKGILPLHVKGAVGTLKYTILEQTPHSEQEWVAWMKEGFLTLKGMPLVALESEPLILADQAPWHVLATSHPWEVIYPKYAKVRISNDLTQNAIAEIPLENFLSEGFIHPPYQFSGKLELKHLNVRILNDETDTSENIEISIDGQVPTPYPKRDEILLPRLYSVSVHSLPLVVFHSVQHKNPSITLINSAGEVYEIADNETSLFAYARGFGGYAAILEKDWPAIPDYRQQRWDEVSHALGDALNKGALLQPIQLLQKVGKPLANTLIEVLEQWIHSGTWLSSSLPYANEIDWTKANPSDLVKWKQQAALFQLLQATAGQGEDVMGKLAKMLHVESTDKQQLLHTLLYYADTLAPYLPPLMPSNSLILSAALRDSGIHPELFVEEFPLAKAEQPLKIESKLHSEVSLQSSLTKWEDNRPAVLMQFKDGKKEERVHLHFDKYGSQLKVPILDGKYLVRYQSAVEKIPYRLRLKEARQINYPGTNQPFSFEADIAISGNDFREDATISMNNVYETWDGYRFYLANIQSGKREDLQHVQIVVNRDPAKYILTMPGFILLLIGAFWLLLRFSAR
jgi:hypothetical protein